MKTVWYLDDNNVKHITVINSTEELQFLQERFNYVGILPN